jgi:ketosteroid isomerase-like protein
MMLSWLASKTITRKMRAIGAGNPGPMLKMNARDVRFRFPGNSSWATEVEGKEKVAAWFERFAALGIEITPDEVLLKGFPSKQTLCVRGRVTLDNDADERVYDNRWVIWGHMRWGRVHEYEFYEDTQRCKLLDEYLISVRKHQV